MPKTHRQRDGSNTSKGVTAKFLDSCEFNVHPGFTSVQPLVTIKLHVSSTLDDIGKECTPDVPPPHHLHEMMNELEVTDKPHKKDALRIQRAQQVCDYAARFRLLGFLRSWIRNDLEVRQVETDIDASEESASMLSTVIESALSHSLRHHKVLGRSAGEDPHRSEGKQLYAGEVDALRTSELSSY